MYDDGDLGVYRHNGDANYTRNELKQKYNKNNTSGGGTKMGTTLTKYSFARDGDFSKPYGKINFGSNWNEVMIQWGINSSSGLFDYGNNAANNEIYDLKSKETGKEYEGSIIFDNVYGSRRDAGNFLAGAVAAKSIFSTESIIYGYGAYNASGNNKIHTLYTIGFDMIVVGGLLKPPYYGEAPQSGSAILQGVKHHKKFPDNWFFPRKIMLRK